jgi:hypothetical protein
MILSNITAYTAPCSELLKLEVEVTPIDDKGGYYPAQSRSVTAPPPSPYPSASSKTVPALPLLVDAFASAATEGSKRKGRLHFLGSVFANLSIVSASIDIHFGSLNGKNTDTRRTEVLSFPPQTLLYSFFRFRKI